jgi:hypothetical protein
MVMDGHGHGDGRSRSKRNWNGTGTELARNWNGTGTELERNWNGTGTELERSRHGHVKVTISPHGDAILKKLKIRLNACIILLLLLYLIGAIFFVNIKF